MTPPALVRAGHVCWAYDDLGPYDEFARAYLSAGLAAGERVWAHRPGTDRW